MKQNCIIVGAGTYGQVYAKYLKDFHHIIGFIDDDAEIIGNVVDGIEVLGNLDFLLKEVDKSVLIFVPIGNNAIRIKILSILIENGFKTPSFFHSNSNVDESVVVGKAVYILGATTIMPFTTIEDFVMISVGVNVAHHTILKTGCFLSQGVNVGASIIIGKNAFVGIGSTIMTGVKEVGECSVIGAGAVIIADVPKNTVNVGNPGKIIKYL